MNPSYISKNLIELLDNAPDYVLDLIDGGEVNNTTAILGKVYKLPVADYVALSNLISYILVGALKPEDVTRAIVDMLHLSQEDALRLASDLDKSILEKARIKILGKAPTEMVELTFKEGRSAEDLRKEIMDTTKRESGLVKEQSSAPKEGLAADSTPPTAVPVETVVVAPAPAATTETAPPAAAPPAPAPEATEKTALPGSRSQLLEQLRVLDDIPDDEEITARLAKIQEQISSIDKKDSSALDSNIPLQNFMFGEKAADTVAPDTKTATYSKAPTKYNVDPYRESVEE